jgi:Flp pilus assembly protein TadG
MLRKRRFPAPLLHCEKGVTAIEFALLSPVLFLLVMGIVEFAVVMFVSVVLEGATDVTARLGSTGYVPTGVSQSQEIINNVDTVTSGLLDPNKIIITTTSYSNFNNIGQNGQGTPGLGGPGDVVVYTVSYPWPIMTPIVSAVIGTTINLSASTVVRNEPY